MITTMTEIERAETEREKRLENNLFSDMKELLPYLEDKEVTDIEVNDSGEIVIEKFGKGVIYSNVVLSAIITQRIILAAAAVNGFKIDNLNGFPKFEGVIPRYNARITGILPPAVCRPELSIRRPSEVIRSLEDYLNDNQLNQEQYNIIVKYIREEKNIVIAGSTGSGKTTFTNAVIKKMEEFTPDKKFYIVEDTPELRCNARRKNMICVNKMHIQEALETSLRFKPNKIIFGEIRNGIVLSSLFEAWNTGHCGNITTIHANNCLSTIQRLKDLLKNVNNEFEKLSDTIQLIVHLKRTDSEIKIDEILEVKDETDNFISLIEQNNLG